MHEMLIYMYLFFTFPVVEGYRVRMAMVFYGLAVKTGSIALHEICCCCCFFSYFFSPK